MRVRCFCKPLVLSVKCWEEQDVPGVTFGILYNVAQAQVCYPRVSLFSSCISVKPNHTSQVYTSRHSIIVLPNN